MKQLTVYFALAGLLGLSSFSKIDKNSPEPNTLRKEELRKIKYENDVRFLQQNTVQNCENPNFGANWKPIVQLEVEKQQREQREWLCSYGWVYREWAKTDMTDAQALAVAEYKYTEFTKRFVNHPDLNLFKKYAITAILRDFGLLKAHDKTSRKKIAFYLNELKAANSKNTGLYYYCLKALNDDLSEEILHEHITFALAQSEQSVKKYEENLARVPTNIPDLQQKVFARKEVGNVTTFMRKDGSINKDTLIKHNFLAEMLNDLSQVPNDKKGLFKEITLNDDELKWRNKWQKSKREGVIKSLQEEIAYEKNWQVLFAKL